MDKAIDRTLTSITQKEKIGIFGDYDVEITVPSDHLVAATGTLQNESAVLTATQKKRLQEARESFVK